MFKQATNNQKRARTRITDEQLKILRAHFDINNSPSEESIMEMSKKANLPMKVSVFIIQLSSFFLTFEN